MVRPDSNAIAVAWLAVPALLTLQARWLLLEAQADASFFTSWSWIGCWLRGLGQHMHPQLLQATRGGQVVGLAVWVGHRARRLKWLPSRCLNLHATGHPGFDEITIEHNGFLLHRDGRAEIEAAMYRHVLERAGQWDQLSLPGLAAQPPLAQALPKGLVLREAPRPSYAVDLAEVRQRGGDYLGMLSSNSRQQIRRSLKAYEALGVLAVTEAPDVGTALSYLQALRQLHEKRWAKDGEPSVFANPAFEAFHTRLVSESFGSGAIQMLRAQAGSHDLGYLYSFVHRGRVLFYQSGLNYDLLQAHGRPGLVTHTLGVQHNAALGHETYDLMAGTSRYKSSLASAQQAMVWAVVHRKTLAFRLEEALRDAKRRWQARGQSQLLVP